MFNDLMTVTCDLESCDFTEVNYYVTNRQKRVERGLSLQHLLIKLINFCLRTNHRLTKC